MKLSDYVEAQMIDPTRGLIKDWRVMAWALWALLFKPERFRVKDLDEDIELGMGGGQVRRLFAGLGQVVLGTLKALFSLLGITLLLTYLVLSPLGIVMMRVAAHCMAWRSRRRRAKLLAEARADLTNRVPPQ
jgi:hypothetical protein